MSSYQDRFVDMATVTTEEDDGSDSGSDQTSASFRGTGLPWIRGTTARGNGRGHGIPRRIPTPAPHAMILCQECGRRHANAYVHARQAAVPDTSAHQESESDTDSSRTLVDPSCERLSGGHIDRVYNWVWGMNFVQRAGYPPPRYLSNFSEFHNDPRALEYLRYLVDGQIFNGPRLEDLPPAMVSIIMGYLRDSAGQSWALEMSRANQVGHEDFDGVPDSVPGLGHIISDLSSDQTFLDSEALDPREFLVATSEILELEGDVLETVDGSLDLLLPDENLRQELEDELSRAMFRFENDF